MTVQNKIFSIAKKNHLISLIRKLGRLVGEDEEFLQEYAQEQFKAWEHDIDRAIKCFQDLIIKEENKGVLI